MEKDTKIGDFLIMFKKTKKKNYLSYLKTSPNIF